MYTCTCMYKIETNLKVRDSGWGQLVNLKNITDPIKWISISFSWVENIFPKKMTP